VSGAPRAEVIGVRENGHLPHRADEKSGDLRVRWR
jgi:hypothetical protein